MHGAAPHFKCDRRNPAATSSLRQGGPWTAWAIVALTVLAPALGGSTELWTQAVIILGTGVLFLLFAARRSLGPVMNVLFIAIGAAALIGFLPAHWFPSSQWRTVLSNLGVHLPDTQSPQPWLTLESTCVFWLGLAWMYYLFAYEWKPALREKAWKLELCPDSGGWSAPRPGSEPARGLPPIQLYDLANDIGERTNLQDRHPEVAERLTKLLERYVADGRSTPGAPQTNTTPVAIYRTQKPQ